MENGDVLHSVAPFLGFAALLAAGWGWMRVKDATRKAATRAVFRKDHHGGEAEAHGVTSLRVPAEPADALAHAIKVVNAYEAPPKIVAGLFLASRGTASAVFAFGSRLGNSFTMQLSFNHGPQGGSVGLLRCLNWSEVDGLVSDVPQIQRLRSRVETAVVELGGTAVDEVQQPQQP